MHREGRKLDCLPPGAKYPIYTSDQNWPEFTGTSVPPEFLVWVGTWNRHSTLTKSCVDSGIQKEEDGRGGGLEIHQIAIWRWASNPNCVWGSGGIQTSSLIWVGIGHPQASALHCVFPLFQATAFNGIEAVLVLSYLSVASITSDFGTVNEVVS